MLQIRFYVALNLALSNSFKLVSYTLYNVEQGVDRGKSNQAKCTVNCLKTFEKVRIWVEVSIIIAFNTLRYTLTLP